MKTRRPAFGRLAPWCSQLALLIACSEQPAAPVVPPPLPPVTLAPPVVVEPPPPPVEQERPRAVRARKRGELQAKSTTTTTTTTASNFAQAPTEEKKPSRRKKIFQAIGMFARGVLDPDSMREVSVNGRKLDRAGLAQIDHVNCGQTVPDGAYWLDLQHNAWGVAGGPARPLPNCAPPPPPPQQGYVAGQGTGDGYQNTGGYETEGDRETDNAAEIRRLRREREQSRMQTEITQMQNNLYNH